MSGNEVTPIRATDQERQQTIDLLSQALTEGQLQPAEFDERCRLAWAACFRRELAPLTADLVPETETTNPAAIVRPAPTASSDDRPKRAVVVGVLGGGKRKGRWPVPRHTITVGCLGGVELDMRECSFPPGETLITAVACLGGVEIRLPDNVIVVNQVLGILGGSKLKHRSGDLPAGAPVVRIRGLSALGGVEIN